MSVKVGFNEVTGKEFKLERISSGSIRLTVKGISTVIPSVDWIDALTAISLCPSARELIKRLNTIIHNG
jgi:hypothetical protein